MRVYMEDYLTAYYNGPGHTRSGRKPHHELFHDRAQALCQEFEIDTEVGSWSHYLVGSGLTICCGQWFQTYNLSNHSTLHSFSESFIGWLSADVDEGQDPVKRYILKLLFRFFSVLRALISHPWASKWERWMSFEDLLLFRAECLERFRRERKLSWHILTWT